ncbi:MAG: hypothetical protein DSY42_09375 [Aquifex sp.]|nr:MAG: hypothetical protein DSY42_09375 [Aquifex sp.]
MEEIGRVLNTYQDEEGFLLVDVATAKDTLSGLKVCGRTPAIGETVVILDRQIVLTATKAPRNEDHPSGSDYIVSTPKTSSVEVNPFAVDISSGDLAHILVTFLDDLIRLVSRRLEIHNDGFSLETFYKTPGNSVFRLAGSCDTDLNRSEVYDWFIVVEDDTIKLEKWDKTLDKSSETENLNRRNKRGIIHIMKDNLLIEVIDENTGKVASINLMPDYMKLATTDGNNTITAEMTLDNYKFSVNGTNGSTTIDITGGNVTVNCSGNASVTVNGNTDITVGGNANVNVTGKTTIVSKGTIDIDGGSGLLGGVVNSQCLCPFIGSPHVDFSATVKASK